MKKLAFMFLTYDNLNKIEIWERFFKDVDPNLYSIYSHPKWPQNVTQSIIKNHIIPEYAETQKYGIGESVAHLHLIKNAFMDPDNYKSIIISNSCIPLYNFNKIHNELTKDDKGSMGISVTDHRISRHGQLLDKNFVAYDKFATTRHEGQCFNREMMEVFLNNNFIDIFKNVFCPSEHYFPNVLIHLDKTNLVHDKNLTFANWGTGDNPDWGTSHIKTYDILTDEDIQKARDSKYLFMRKIGQYCQIKDLSYLDNY